MQISGSKIWQPASKMSSRVESSALNGPVPNECLSKLILEEKEEGLRFHLDVKANAGNVQRDG